MMVDKQNTNAATGTALPLSAEDFAKIEKFRKDKQTAVLAILFSDIVNSTYGAEKLGEQDFARLRHVHDQLFIRVMMADNAGRIIKSIGDSFLCVFAEPTTAVSKAIQLQETILANHNHLTSNGFSIVVRIGIHLGQVALEDHIVPDIFGRHVNRAARVESLASGGQILTTLAVWENAVGWIKDNSNKNLHWRSYGKIRLKGVDEKVEVFTFYSDKMGRQSLPRFYKTKKTNRLLGISGSLLVLVLAIAWCWKTGFLQPQMKTQQPQEILVQFSFQNHKAFKSTADTSTIQAGLLSEVINVFSDARIITEKEIADRCFQHGKIYRRHRNESSLDSPFFRDTLRLSQALFVTVDSILSDSLYVHIRLETYPDSNGSTASHGEGSYALKDFKALFKNDLREILASTTKWTIEGYVKNFNDSILLIRTSKECNLRQGTSIRFMRNYASIQAHLSAIQTEVDYQKTYAKDTLRLAQLRQQYQQLSALDPSAPGGSYSLQLYGQIQAVTDSIASAKWLSNEVYLKERPRQGDIVYLDE